MRRVVGRTLLVLLATGLLSKAAAAQDVGVEDLRCAAGYGCQDVGALQCDVLARLGISNAREARDLFAQTYPATFVEVARNMASPPAECLRASGSGGGTSAGGTTPEEDGEPALPDFAGLDGYAETPCPGNVSVDPIFVPGRPDIRVLACFKGSDNLYRECGKAPARAYCLKFGKPDVACFGDIKRVGKAATVDAYCETGECPAFGFIVCK